MMKKIISIFLITIFFLALKGESIVAAPIRIMVITGGHDFEKEKFNLMLSSLGPSISFQILELPAAFDMFRPENRNKYDVLVFYHMWQKISAEEARIFDDCIRQGKPLVVLHHSICAFDEWPLYWEIIGGKYFHTQTTYKGKVYGPCSYIHDVHFTVRIADRTHPVTRGLEDFQIFDETYKGYYVSEDATPLLTTDEPSSTPVIGWAKSYGKARVVVLQSGHDVPTFENPNFRKLLKQSIEWVFVR